MHMTLYDLNNSSLNFPMSKQWLLSATVLIISFNVQNSKLLPQVVITLYQITYLIIALAAATLSMDLKWHQSFYRAVTQQWCCFLDCILLALQRMGYKHHLLVLTGQQREASFECLHEFGFEFMHAEIS